MLAPTPLTIGGITVHARGRLDLLETRLVHIAGSLDPTPHGSVVAEHAAIAIAAHSTSCALLDDGPGVAAAALDALMLAAPDRAVVVARRGVTDWHDSLAARGALILDGASALLLTELADTTLIIEQMHSEAPRSPHVACVPGPILTPATAGSNALLLHPDVEIVPDLELWARRLDYIPPRQRHVAVNG
ncbi:MAG: hypothetical protein ACTIB2_09000 [Brachybacterium tyrofermentans]